jgi:hypothetical protein
VLSSSRSKGQMSDTDWMHASLEARRVGSVRRSCHLLPLADTSLDQLNGNLQCGNLQ